jgi:hypothetical protein
MVLVWLFGVLVAAVHPGVHCLHQVVPLDFAWRGGTVIGLDHCQNLNSMSEDAYLDKWYFSMHDRYEWNHDHKCQCPVTREHQCSVSLGHQKHVLSWCHLEVSSSHCHSWHCGEHAHCCLWWLSMHTIYLQILSCQWMFAASALQAHIPICSESWSQIYINESAFVTKC